VVRSLKKKIIKQALAFCVGLAIATLTEPCWAIDYQPFDFVPAAPGTMMMMGYYEFETRNQVNNTIAGTFNHDTSLSSQIGLARYLYYNQFNGTPFLLEWLQPFGVEYNGKINGTRLNDAWGASDLILSGTLWPISKPQQKTWVSVSDWITVPSGSYTHTRAVNLGANRWQGGYCSLSPPPCFISVAGATVSVRSKPYGQCRQPDVQQYPRSRRYCAVNTNRPPST